MNYYKKLEKDELQALEKEFINFLIVNGITGEDWEKLKQKDAKKADSIIDEFSSVVYESSLRKARFLLIVDDKVVRCFQCGEDKITLVSLTYIGEKTFSFHDIIDLGETLKSSGDQFKIVSANKAYAKKREHEMFDMIQAGCKFSDGKVYKMLAMYWAELKSRQN